MTATTLQRVPFIPTSVSGATSEGTPLDASCTSGSSNSNDQCNHGGFEPNIIYRKKRTPTVRPAVVDVEALINQLMVESVNTMSLHLSSNKDELDALINALIVNPERLGGANSSHGGLIISTALTLVLNELRGQVLLEVIVSSADLLWDLATQTVGLQNIYDMADQEWRLRLHKFLIPRLGELSAHSQGNYMVSHMLRAYPTHQDSNLMAAATSMFSDGAELVNMCQGKSAVFVAVVWASVVPPELAQSSLESLLQHPKAQFVLYRLAMSAVAYKILSALLGHLAHSKHEHLATVILTQHVCGARYAGKIRAELRSLGMR